MSPSHESSTTGALAGGPSAPGRAAHSIERLGRVVALIGVVLPLLLIGGLKFTFVETEALRPLINGTPWLAWLYPAFRRVGCFSAAWCGRTRGCAVAGGVTLVSARWRDGRRARSVDLSCRDFAARRTSGVGDTPRRVSCPQSAWPIPDQGRGAAWRRPRRHWRMLVSNTKGQRSAHRREDAVIALPTIEASRGCCSGRTRWLG